jgi:hypothetical protein
MFSLNEQETKKLKKWREKHNKKCEFTNAQHGGTLTYKFTPTGIGTIVKVKCACGKEIDLTDPSNW